MKRTLILYIFILLLGYRPLSARPVGSEIVLEYLLQLKPDVLEIDELISEPKDLSQYNMAGYINLLHTFLHFNENETVRFYERQKTLLHRADKMLSTEEFNISQANICLNNLLIAATYGTKMKILREGLRYHTAMQNIAMPDNAQCLKHQAIQHVIYSVVVNEVPFSKTILSGDYSKEKGLQLMAEAVNKAGNKSDKFEILLWAEILNLYVNNDYSPSESANVKHYPLFRLIEMLRARRAGNNDEVLRLAALNTLEHENDFSFFILLKAEAELRNRKVGCIEDYRRFLDNNRSMLFNAMAGTQLTWACRIFDVDSGVALQVLPNTDKTYLAIDMYYAREELYLGGRLVLLEARLLFDGGYYKRALDILHKVTDSNLKKLPEYMYRMARIRHKLKDYEGAIGDYIRVMTNAPNTDPYAAKACYFAGILSCEVQYYNLAELYFTKLDEYKHFPYEQALKNDARLRLNEIETMRNGLK